MRAHSVPKAVRQALPSPPRAPAASAVRLLAHSRASVRMTRASTPDSSAAHSGVLGTPSVSPST